MFLNFLNQCCRETVPLNSSGCVESGHFFPRILNSLSVLDECIAQFGYKQVAHKHNTIKPIWGKLLIKQMVLGEYGKFTARTYL